jgi:hypothetical protein
MRRLLIEEPVSKPAVLGARVATFATLVVVMAVLLARFGRLQPEMALGVFAGGLVAALVAAILAVAGLVQIWNDGARGLGPALRGLVLVALVMAYPAWLAGRAVTLPRVTDVSTDPMNPPDLPGARPWTAAGGPPPKPLLLAGEVAPLAELSREAALALGWQVTGFVRPARGQPVARLIAVTRSPVMKLPGDVAVRLTPFDDGVRIDVRSATRVGEHDMGANAARIRAFLERLEDLAADQDIRAAR